MPGLREEKKARTRALIAAAASALFARDGYPDVTMAQVAAAAGVADQTLYNYFPTKESLVFDRSDELERSLTEALAGRAPGAGVVEAYALWLDAFVLGGAARRALASPGGMPRLVASSDALHRGLLEFAHRAAANLASQLDGVSLAVADALLAVLVRVIEQLGAAPDDGALTRISASARASVEVLRPLG
jgi:AcrR family transcriptional regulator